MTLREESRATTFAAYLVAIRGGADDDEARTIAVNALVAMEIAYLFACRSLRHSMRTIGLFSNRWIWVGVVGMLGLQFAFTYLPVMHSAFGSAPMSAMSWLFVLGMAPVTYALVAALAWWESRRIDGDTVLPDGTTRSATAQGGGDVGPAAS